MDSLFERLGLWLAGAYALYGFVFLLLPALLFLHAVLLAGLVWTLVRRARGRDPWTFLPAGARRAVGLGIELVFGLINPLLYLIVLIPSMPALRRDAEHWWLWPLLAAAWALFGSLWVLRMFGALLDRGRPGLRTVVAALLGSASVCLALFAVKDLRVLMLSPLSTEGGGLQVLNVLVRLSPLYLIPLVLLADYLRATIAARGPLRDTGLFLFRDRTARLIAGGLAAIAAVTIAAGVHRSSDAAVRALVGEHRLAIAGAAARYDVDPKLVAAIVYVTHREQLSPFRGALERLVVGMWTMGYWPGIGANETLLNRPLDISVGVAQIKPRTAQTATLLVTGRAFSDLARQPAYRDGEPVGESWRVLPISSTAAAPPIDVPASRQDVVHALLTPRQNLEMCGLVLSLYQRQWEAANPAWSLRRKPEILATLYQIGFARSKPHAAPRSNAFGARVREVFDEPWLDELFPGGPAPARPMVGGGAARPRPPVSSRLDAEAQ